MTSLLFPFADYWWFYAGFTVFVLILLALDLGVFHRKSHAVSAKEAAIWSAVWVSLALLFNYCLYVYASWRFATHPRYLDIEGFNAALAAKAVALEFLTGYVVEKSLSVDNLFVFVLVFSYFQIPAKYQHRVLFFGIIGALIFRAIFIALGSFLMRYEVVVLLFGLFLIFTGVKMCFSSNEEIEPEKNLMIRILRKFLPVTHHLREGHFFVRENGILKATPLFVALLFLEVTDVIFAFDSVPAIFAISKEPLIVFTSNIFAILGLRSLYFLLANVIDRFYLLKYGLAAVLVFVGLKMVWLNEHYGGKFPIGVSLGLIAAIIGSSVVLSLLFPKDKIERPS